MAITPWLWSCPWSRDNGRFELELIVPVGTEASVVLPGRRETELVGPGSHRWVVPDPHGGPGVPVRTLRDVMDSPDLWRRVVGAASASGVTSGEADTARTLARNLDRPIADLARTLAPPETFRPSGDLAARLADLFSASPDADTPIGPAAIAGAGDPSGRTAAP